MLSQPRLRSQDWRFYVAFNSLSASRPNNGMGVSPIPMSELLSYCQLVGIANFSERSKYLRLVQSLDRVFLEHQSEKLKAQK